MAAEIVSKDSIQLMSLSTTQIDISDDQNLDEVNILIIISVLTHCLSTVG